jgi:hypothetical protein
MNRRVPDGRTRPLIAIIDEHPDIRELYGLELQTGDMK